MFPAKSVGNSSSMRNFQEKCHVTCHVTIQKCHCHLQNVKDSEICPCAKFRFYYIFVARNIANKHFSLKKAPDPSLKHLERMKTDCNLKLN